jgi:hypothetical protein
MECKIKYARVDLSLLQNGELELNEIILCPGNCNGSFDDPDLDRRFAGMTQDLTFAG